MLASPPAASVTAAVSITPGSGSMTTPAGAYELGELRYIRFPRGGGALQFVAGAGAVSLSGSQAKDLGSGGYALTIDHVTVLTSRRASAQCEVRGSAEGGGFARVTCRGMLLPSAEPFRLAWAAW